MFQCSGPEVWNVFCKGLKLSTHSSFSCFNDPKTFHYQRFWQKWFTSIIHNFIFFLRILTPWCILLCLYLFSSRYKNLISLHFAAMHINSINFISIWIILLSNVVSYRVYFIFIEWRKKNLKSLKRDIKQSLFFVWNYKKNCNINGIFYASKQGGSLLKDLLIDSPPTL